MSTDIRVYAHPDLKELLGREADKMGLPMSERVVQILAEHFERPDLAIPPRRAPGRPRGTGKKLAAVK